MGGGRRRRRGLRGRDGRGARRRRVRSRVAWPPPATGGTPPQRGHGGGRGPGRPSPTCAGRTPARAIPRTRHRDPGRAPQPCPWTTVRRPAPGWRRRSRAPPRRRGHRAAVHAAPGTGGARRRTSGTDRRGQRRPSRPTKPSSRRGPMAGAQQSQVAQSTVSADEIEDSAGKQGAKGDVVEERLAGARWTSFGPSCRGHPVTSSTMLNGVSATRVTLENPASVAMARSRASPAWAPRAVPTSWERELGVQSSVEKP